MQTASSGLVAHGTCALAALDALTPGDPNPSEKLAELMRLLVAMRDDLIAAQRAGADCGESLRRMNAIVSSIYGMEFPSEGLQWQRVCDTRDALRAWLGDHTPQS